jgi:transcriptional/translational regulatory protein YebC/TACO1
MFEKKGVIAISALDEWGDRVVEGDKLMEEALEAGAADFAEEGDVFEIYTEPDDLSAVAEELTAKGYTFISSEVEKVPSSYVTLESEEDIKFMNLLLENLEENEDIVNVWHNWDEE